MNIEENDDQMVDTSLLPDFSLLGIDEEQTDESQNEDQEENEPEIIDDVQAEPEETLVEEQDIPEEVSESEIEAIASFYEMFKEKGILPEKEINSWEDLESEIEAYKTSLPEQVKESIISSASEESQNLLKYALTKPNATKQDIIEYLRAEESDNEVASISTDEQAREYLKKSYSSQFDEDVLDTMLDAMEDKGTLQDKAKQVSDSQSEKMLQSAQQEQLEQEEYNKQWKQSIASEFNSQPWKQDHKQKVMEQFNGGELDKRVQQIIQDPKSLVQLANILYYYDTDSKEFNLDTFFTQANTKKTTSVRDRIVASAQRSGSSTQPNKRSNNNGFDLNQYELVN